MLLLIDNYDSFVHNLARYVEELGVPTEVVRHDALSVEQISQRSPQAIILSPGPGRPEDAGVCGDIVRQLGHCIPILGVCLGHQVIGQVLGGQVIRAPAPVHAMTSEISHDSSGVFAGLPQDFAATRYHSLIVDSGSIPVDLRVNAVTGDGLVMGLIHRRWPLHGVQFHPESILTSQGHQLLANFLHLAGFKHVRPNPVGDLPGPTTDDADFFRATIGADAHRPL